MERVAVPIYRHRVAPAFDFSNRVLLVNQEASNSEAKNELVLQGFSTTERIEALVKAGVHTLICGGISDGLCSLIRNAGIQVIWGVAGPIEEILEAHRCGHLDDARFYMPGNGKSIAAR